MKISSFTFSISLILCFSTLAIFSSCNKSVQVDPPFTSTNGDNAFNSDQSAIAIMNGVYTKISATRSNSIALSLTSLSWFAGLSADELSLWAGALNTNNAFNVKQKFYYENELASTSTASYGTEFWTSFYNLIYICNSVIEGANKSKQLSPGVQSQLLGEAKFCRALFYFYLVNLYGAVPIPLTDDYKLNTSLSRQDPSVVYDQIEHDLVDAKGKLSKDYLDATLLNLSADRTRPTSWAASALLSRVYLYRHRYDSAESEATLLINNSSLFGLEPLSQVFLANSLEAIWQLQPVNSGWNTEDARLFLLPAKGPSSNNSVFLSSQLLDSFETNDARRALWVDSVVVAGTTYFYPSKYKSAQFQAPITEYTMVFRLAEQVLIRAESRIMQGNLTGGLSDLNVIRGRAGLIDTSANDENGAMSLVIHERQIELFTELGQRWLDLKRTNVVNTHMPYVTPGKASGHSWVTTQQLYPLPFNDVIDDPALMQNPGY